MVTPKKIIALLLLMFSVNSLGAPVTHVVIFGDSLSDAGMNTPTDNSGNNFWVKGRKNREPFTNLDPNTETNPLWINWVNQHLFPHETLYTWRNLHSSQIDPASHNVNYAYASAETGAHYLNDISGEFFPPYVDSICHIPGKIEATTACVPGVLKQIQLYLDAVHHPKPDTVFVIWAGGNDIFNNITKVMTLFSREKISDISTRLLQLFGESEPAKKINLSGPLIPEFSDPVINLLAAKDRLIEAGVKPEQIYVINLPDLSKTPAGIRLANGNASLLSVIHLVTVTFNQGLLLALSDNILNKNNLPKSHILSVYDLLNDVYDNPKKYAMTHLSESCVTDKELPLCTGYVFFNDKHPTVETGKIIAAWVSEKITLLSPH